MSSSSDQKIYNFASTSIVNLHQNGHQKKMKSITIKYQDLALDVLGNLNYKYVFLMVWIIQNVGKPQVSEL